MRRRRGRRRRAGSGLVTGNDESASALAERVAEANAQFQSDETIDKLKKEWGGGPTVWWEVKDICDYCIASREEGLATSWVISGKWGSGKTQLSQEIAMGVDADYSLRRNVLLNPDSIQIVRLIDAMGKKCAPILDEAIMQMFSLKFYDERQQTFQQYITANLRKELEGTLICNIPNTYDFQTSFMRSCVDFWIRIICPGLAVIFMRDNSECPDPFYKDELSKNWKEAAKDSHTPVEVRNTNINFQLSVFSRHLTFFRILTFPRLENEVYAEYLAYYHENWERNKEAFLQYSYERQEYRHEKALKFKAEREEKLRKERVMQEAAALLNRDNIFRCGCIMRNGKYVQKCELHTGKPKKVAANENPG